MPIPGGWGGPRIEPLYPMAGKPGLEGQLLSVRTTKKAGPLK